MSRQTTRRDFLKTGAAAGVGFWVAGGLEGAQPRRPGPNERLNVGFVGVGGRGAANLGSIGGTENVVALCDVDNRLSQEGGPNAIAAYERYPRAAIYSDFRRMLDQQRNLDAVVVSTPDHMHAIAAITAMRLGKHCYTEKPLTHDVWEARQMKLVAAANRVATQMGNQGTANDTLRRGVEVIRSGAIGPVREIHVWTNRPIWPQGMTARPATQPVPDYLAWDLWLGVAQARDYNQAYMPFKWRGWWDFGTGAIGDMACHTMNLPFMALRLGAPTSVSAQARMPVNNEAPPEGCTITYEFPARRVEGSNEELPPVRMVWYERGYPPNNLFLGAIREGQRPSGSGSLMIGARGTMYSPSDYGGEWRLLPQEQFQNYQPPAPTLPRVGGAHHREWIDACKGGRPAMSNFVDYASVLTEAALLGNVALRAGQRIEWDTVNLRVTNLADANRFIRREYRQGWNIEPQRS